MATVATKLKGESQPPQDSIIPMINETFPEWSERIDKMLQEFKARELK